MVKIFDLCRRSRAWDLIATILKCKFFIANDLPSEFYVLSEWDKTCEFGNELHGNEN